jgi:hypothetical protein
MIMEYSVGDVAINETKFISVTDDVISTIITSSSPVTIEFEGRSFYSYQKSLTKTADCGSHDGSAYDAANNAIHIVEGGTVTTAKVRRSASGARAMSFCGGQN